MKQSLAMIETVGLVTAIEASDAAMKSANVELIGWKKIGSGMISVFFSGDVASTKTAVEAAVEAASKVGKVTSVDVIARPHGDLSKLVDILK